MKWMARSSAFQLLRRFQFLILSACSLLVFSSVARQQTQVFQGSWTASVGTGDQVFRGAWSAQASSQSPNSLLGSWTLFSDSGEISLQGTWAARKSPAGWQGTWSARASTGGAFAGTWKADSADFSGKTFEEMIKHTVAKQVAGSWRSGRYQGYWWLQGTAPKPPRH